MPRKYAVLKQFTQDLDRLLLESESAFLALRNQAAPTQAQILAVYRPIHSLKGICGMVEETKLLVRAFHALEDLLPPLLPLRVLKMRENSPEKADWTIVADGTLKMAREVERILIAKLDLWKKLGADDHELRGLVISFTHAGVTERIWVAITRLEGLIDQAEVSRGASGYAGVIGRSKDVDGAENEALILESPDGPVALYFDDIETTCTRLEAADMGASRAFKDWWAIYAKRRTSSAA